MFPARNLKRFISKALAQPGYACSVFFRRLRAYREYRRRTARVSSPESLTIFLTHRCNLRCKMCGQWGEAGVTRAEGQAMARNELTLAELTGLIDQVARFHPSITLFGGEPLLFADCLALIRAITSRRLHCLMITNGYLVSERAEALVESGLDELNVSVDGPRQLHDAIRGMPGLFDRIMAGLDRVNHYKALRRTAKPLVNLQCTITRYNYEHLERMLEVAAACKADSLTFHNLIFLDAQTLAEQQRMDALLGCDSKQWQGFVFEPGIDPVLVAEKRRYILKHAGPLKVDFYPNLSDRQLRGYYAGDDNILAGQTLRCLSPWLVAYVFPDGEVRPCLNLSYSFGNIRTARFDPIWNSEAARRFRSVLSEHRSFPACVRCTELYRY